MRTFSKKMIAIEKSSLLTYMTAMGHEQLVFCQDEETGLITQLNKLYNKLIKVNNFNELGKRVNSLSIEVDDINHELRAIYSHEEHDTNKLSILYIYIYKQDFVLYQFDCMKRLK